MTKEQYYDLLSFEHKSLYNFLNDNIEDLLVGELSKDELVRLFMNTLKYKNSPLVHPIVEK